MSKRALIVEDDGNIAELLRLYLGKDGFEVMIAPDGGKAESSFDLFQPDVVLLDIMLPIKDGWQICRDIRKKSSVPIIMLTAKGETNDKVSGLEMGADDYVTKPFEVKELIARIHAVMRRKDGETAMEKKLEFDKLTINLDSYELIVDGRKIDTPPKEMELLFHLASSPNRVFTRNQLLDEVWGFDYFGDSRTVDVHVKRLREKLEGASDKWCLKTDAGHRQLPAHDACFYRHRAQLCHQRLSDDDGVERGRGRASGLRRRGLRRAALLVAEHEPQHDRQQHGQPYLHHRRERRDRLLLRRTARLRPHRPAAAPERSVTSWPSRSAAAAAA